MIVAVSPGVRRNPRSAIAAAKPVALSLARTPPGRRRQRPPFDVVRFSCCASAWVRTAEGVPTSPRPCFQARRDVGTPSARRRLMTARLCLRWLDYGEVILKDAGDLFVPHALKASLMTFPRSSIRLARTCKCRLADIIGVFPMAHDHMRNAMQRYSVMKSATARRCSFSPHGWPGAAEIAT